MGIGGTELLAVDDRVVAVLEREGLQRGEVGTGAGFGIALAPNLLGGEHRRQIAAALLIGTPMHQGGADEADTLRVDEGGSAGAGEFLVIELLLSEAGAAAAILTGVLDGAPSGGVHF